MIASIPNTGASTVTHTKGARAQKMKVTETHFGIDLCVGRKCKFFDYSIELIHFFVVHFIINIRWSIAISEIRHNIVFHP